MLLALFGVASATSIADIKIVESIFLTLIVFREPSLMASKVMSLIISMMVAFMSFYLSLETVAKREDLTTGEEA